MFTKHFLQATFERAVKTAAQSAVALLGAEMVNVLTIDWLQLGAVSLSAALLSVLTSIGSARVSGHNDPSLV